MKNYQLGIPTSNLFGWCDSTAVLGWLRNIPSKGSVYVVNRATATIELLPACKWRYVATDCNPADLASRGVFPGKLINKELWWKGPLWLWESSASWPIKLDIGDPPVDEDPPLPPLPVLTAQVVKKSSDFKYFSSLH